MGRSKGTPGGGADRRDIVDDLNRLMAEEIEACLRYFQMRFRLRGNVYRAAEQFFENAIKETEGLGLRPNIGIRGLNPTRSSKVLLLDEGIPLRYAPCGDHAAGYVASN